MAKPIIEARVDAATRKAIDTFRENSGFDSSAQAVRVLIGLGLQALAEAGPLSDEKYRTLLYREAYNEIAARVHTALGTVIETIRERRNQKLGKTPAVKLPKSEVEGDLANDSEEHDG
jgi:hypothetical protein